MLKKKKKKIIKKKLILFFVCFLQGAVILIVVFTVPANQTILVYAKMDGRATNATKKVFKIITNNKKNIGQNSDENITNIFSLVICAKDCKHGICINKKKNTCICDVGWSGFLCNETTSGTFQKEIFKKE